MLKHFRAKRDHTGYMGINLLGSENRNNSRVPAVIESKVSAEV